MTQEKETFIKIPTELRKRKDLTTTHKVILGYLLSFQLNGKYCYQTQKEIAEELGTPFSTIKRNITQLEKKGIIKTDFVKNITQKKKQYKNRKATIYNEFKIAQNEPSEIRKKTKSMKETSTKIKIAQNEPFGNTIKQNTLTETEIIEKKPSLKDDIIALKRSFNPSTLSNYEGIIDTLAKSCTTIEQVKVEMKKEEAKRKQLREEAKANREKKKQAEEDKVLQDELFALINNYLNELKRFECANPNQKEKIIKFLKDGVLSGEFRTYNFEKEKALSSVGKVKKQWEKIISDVSNIIPNLPEEIKEEKLLPFEDGYDEKVIPINRPRKMVDDSFTFKNETKVENTDKINMDILNLPMNLGKIEMIDKYLIQIGEFKQGVNYSNNDRFKIITYLKNKTA
ncbi:helix-turn-helix domain-containing protein [Cochleicola gelatinilyticus]|uniref:Helix-turn-helix domain-containing protein n=1 Tax=Cochleicola gelatinilyticus TaxID=1763537 RepID=A0A167HMF2_9FLAO|nr:helix-turn-helix domain-containing protein [Cochleicola gelatinilyticus]OAB78769.1 hypothetical protein ULVI_09310 [Cochleicola gelatinilyticus]